MLFTDAAQVGRGVDHHRGALHLVDPHQDVVVEVALHPTVRDQDLSADQEGRMDTFCALFVYLGQDFMRLSHVSLLKLNKDFTIQHNGDFL